MLNACMNRWMNITILAPCNSIHIVGFLHHFFVVVLFVAIIPFISSGEHLMKRDNGWKWQFCMIQWLVERKNILHFFFVSNRHVMTYMEWTRTFADKQTNGELMSWTFSSLVIYNPCSEVNKSRNCVWQTAIFSSAMAGSLFVLYLFVLQ